MRSVTLAGPQMGTGSRRHRLARSSAAFALALGILGAGCKKPDEGAGKPGAVPDSAASARAPVAAKFAKVEARKVQRRIEVSGTLDPDERSEVAAQTMGTVTRVEVDLGSRVKQGDVLAELDAREAALRVSAAQATSAAQRARLGLGSGDTFDPDQVADVRAAKDGRDLAAAEFERTKALFEAGAVSQALFDQAKSARDRTAAGYEAARNGAEQAWSGLVASDSQAGLASKALEDTKIRAPFDGAVVERRISAGEFAAMGRVVAVVVRDDVLRFRFDIPEDQSALLAAGAPVRLEVGAFPGEVFQGSIKRIGQSVRIATRTLPVEAEVSNSDLRLRPGFFARASVELGGDPVDALYVPKAALGSAGSSQRVFVRQGDKVVERLVTTGAADGDLIEIRGTIAATDEIAISAVAELTDGARIAP
jgi:RND family efflux transporter MFP subunit